MQMPSKQESKGRTYASPSIKADGGDASQLCTWLRRSIRVRLQGVDVSGDSRSTWCGLRQRVILPPPSPPGAPLSATPHFKGGSPPAAAAGAADGDAEAAGRGPLVADLTMAAQRQRQQPLERPTEMLRLLDGGPLVLSTTSSVMADSCL